MENIIVVLKHTFTLFVSSLKLPFLCNLQCETWSEFVLTQFFTAKEGVAQGACAGGFGVCCTFSTKCGGTTYENSTYLTTGESYWILQLEI